MRAVVSQLTILCFWLLCSTFALSQVDFSISKTEIRFDNIGACSSALDSFEITNTGSRTFPGFGTRTVDGFELVSDTNNIDSGKTVKVYVNFVGTSAKSPYRFPHIISARYDSSEIKEDTVWLIGNRLGGPCGVLEVQDISGVPGTDTTLVVTAYSLSKAIDFSTITVTFALAYNPSLLVPKSLPSNVQLRTPGVLDIQVQMRNAAGPLVTIPVTLTLGNDTACVLDINSLRTSLPGLFIEGVDGKLTLSGICKQPGARLFNPVFQPPTQIKVLHGVVELFSEISRTVSIVSVLGDKRSDIALTGKQPNAILNLAAGCYWLVDEYSTIGFIVP